MRRWLVPGLAALVAALLAWALWPKPEDRGNPRFFADTTYNFQVLGALTDTASAGGDTAEAALAVAKITAGNAEEWLAAWREAGDRAKAVAARTLDPTAKGNALLRAHTYYRTAEFFLDPHDPRRPGIWRENIAAFYAGLDTVGVAYERIAVPYGPNHHLNAVFYPGPAGAEKRPLIVFVGGYDSTMEELYLRLAAAAYRRGYSVLTYEGPGQGSVLREQGLTFEPDWEKPNGAVLDAFLAHHPKPSKIVLMGASFGGYLAPRAAAFDSRIDGVIAYDVFYDGYAIATRSVSPAALWLHSHGYDNVVEFLRRHVAGPGANWAVKNGEWVFGRTGTFGVFDAFKDYRLAPIAARITSDVLILAGADDHFVPSDETALFQKSLINARSVTAVLFDRASGGAEHCQIGAPSLMQGAVFDWLATHFPAG